MTAKGVKCSECKFYDHRGICSIKALQVSPHSVRTCKVYAKKRQTPSRA